MGYRERHREGRRKMGIVAMNGNEDLPGDHFWDSEEAEQEYYAVGQAIAKAEEKLKQAQGRLLTVQAVYNRFAETPGATCVIRKTVIYSDCCSHILIMTKDLL